ncbi:MAG: RNA polymerase factor sigma-54 [Pseudomonadales bacterium]|nr:RNA polymerase factor sigma-54 [Pseudomonadales bacterium]
MKQGLQLKFSQQLTMTPQLQQAIKLLQLSTLELSQEITEQLYSNPLLEEITEDQDAENQLKKTNDEKTLTETSNLTAEELEEPSKNTEPLSQETDQNDWDSDFDNYSVQTQDIARINNNDGNIRGEINLEQVHQVTQSLKDHLLWQLNLTNLNARDLSIAEMLTYSLDDNGLLTQNLSEIFEELDENNNEYESEILTVLTRLQQFDPPGVYARDLKECLLIQLNQLSQDTPFLKQAKILVLQFLEDIGKLNTDKLLKKTQLSLDELRGAISLVRSMNPYPGEFLQENDTEYITPDAYVIKTSDKWRAIINDDHNPRLRINETYKNLIRQSDNSKENQYLKDSLTEAKWFIKSLESRNETLLKVVNCIIELQEDFFEHGPVSMKPMILSDISEKLDLHESTISRVTTSKYLATPRGIYELKYFFSSHVATATGGECSSTAVSAILKELINAEVPHKPLSDNKLTELLKEQGINIARRTVAKYREGLGIPSSSDRKRFENVI